jgi:glutaredoxin-related protein
MKKYLISTNAEYIGVGLLDPDTATEDINLSHNLHNTHVNYNYYNGVLSFASLKRFYRFLINKYFIQLWDTNKSFSLLLKEATNMARQTLNNEVEYQNFLPQIYRYKEETGVIYKWHHPKYTNDKIDH